MAPQWPDVETTRRGVILDGALGTLVEDEGWDVRQALWGSVALLSEEGQRLVLELHRRYIDAGAELLIANTHNAGLLHCRRWLGQTPRDDWPAPAGRHPDPAPALMRHINLEAVSAARSAARTKPGIRVAGCLSSPDVPYATRASLTSGEVAQAIGPQLDVLFEAAVDLVLFEMCSTRSDLEGVAAAVNARPHRNRPPIGVGLVCGPDGHLLSGLSVVEAVHILGPAQPEALFIQCTRWDLVEKSLRILTDCVPADTIVGAYGNDARGWVDGRWCGARVTPEAYAEAAERWWRTGARVVGGCCGTTPEHIRALSKRLAPLR